MPCLSITLIRIAGPAWVSWDTSGRNRDFWVIPPGKSKVLADIQGPGRITHIWMTQPKHYRECLIRITWDNAGHASVLCPLGDFFGLGHGLVASYQSLLFSASTRFPYQFEKGCALNCYAPMPFRERAVIELVNESGEEHRQYFYIDFETGEMPPRRAGYFHAEFRRVNPFGGWGPEIAANKLGCRLADVANKARQAWNNNYVILDTKGRGHYIGCNLSVTNFRGDWWGEGDDMILVDGEPLPRLYGTGSEDYFNTAFCPTQEFCTPYHGLILNSGTPEWPWQGKNSVYRYHIERRRASNQLRAPPGKPGPVPERNPGHDRARPRESSGQRDVVHGYWYAENPAPAVAPRRSNNAWRSAAMDAAIGYSMRRIGARASRCRSTPKCGQCGGNGRRIRPRRRPGK